MLQRVIALLRRNARYIRWLVSLLFLYLVIRRIDWGRLFAQLVRADLLLIFAATFIAYGAYYLFRTWRWQILLQAFHIHYPFWKTFEYYCIGFFAGFMLSDSVGAFTRGFYVRKEGHSVATAMVTIFIDKVAEIAGLLFTSLLGLVVFSSAIQQNWLIWLVPLGLVCGVAALWLFGRRAGRWLSRRLDDLLRNRLHLVDENRASQIYGELLSVPLSTWVGVGSVTLLCRLAHYLSVYILARSLGIGLPFLSIAAVMSLVGAAVVLPISIGGGLGVREGVLVGLFRLVEESTESALSLSLLIFLVSLVWRAVGMIFWLKNPLEERCVRSAG